MIYLIIIIASTYCTILIEDALILLLFYKVLVLHYYDICDNFIANFKEMALVIFAHVDNFECKDVSSCIYSCRVLRVIILSGILVVACKWSRSDRGNYGVAVRYDGEEFSAHPSSAPCSRYPCSLKRKTGVSCRSTGGRRTRARGSFI